MNNKPEKKLIAYIDKIIGHDWEMQKIESPMTGEVIPDVFFSTTKTHGMIEFKYIYDWPKRESTKLKLRKFTKEQKAWIYKHGNMKGGGIFLILQIRNEIMVFTWETATHLMEGTRDHLHIMSQLVFDKTLLKTKEDKREIKEYLLDTLNYY
jgi:hypothetical protein